MAYSKSAGVTGAHKKHKHLRGNVPPRTPGPTGHNDAGDPDCHASLGDTAGPLGHNDHGSPIAEDRHRWGVSYTGHRYPAGTKSEVLGKAAPFISQAEGGVFPHPYYPEPSTTSGVTWGVGWDARWRTPEQVKSTWAELNSNDLDKLANTATKWGANAREALGELGTVVPGTRHSPPYVKDIVIPEEVALKVFKDDLEVYYELTGKTFPGFEELPAGVQVALISLVYNRAQGGKMPMGQDHPGALDRKWEMRRIREDVAKQDLVWIYHHLNAMKRVWKGTGNEPFMNKRRSDECELIKPYILEDLKAEMDSVSVLSSLSTA